MRLVGAKRDEIPRAPANMLVATRRAWRVYWESGPGSLATDVDVPAVERLFRKRDELERVERVIRTGRLVKGSMGQVRVNPLIDYAAKLETAILRLEQELGLTPMARMRLGVAVGEAERTLEEMNRRFDDDSGADDVDPRSAVIQLPGAHERREAAT